MKITPIRTSPTHIGRITDIDKNSERKIRSDILIDSLRRTGWFELVWYPFFIIASLVVFVWVSIALGRFSWILAVSIIELWTCMLANNLVARGYRWGLLVSAFSLSLYIFISAYSKVWGEAIINTVLFLPLEIIAYFMWKKSVDSGDRIEDIRVKVKYEPYIWLGSQLVFTVGVWAFLNYVLGQNYAIFNAISMVCFVIGTLIRNKRYIYSWYFYMVGNLAGLALWILVSRDLDLETIPMVLGSFALLTNNFNGLYIWTKIYRHNKKAEGILLHQREVNIKSVVKLRHTYSKLIHRMESQRDMKKPLPKAVQSPSKNDMKEYFSKPDKRSSKNG